MTRKFVTDFEKKYKEPAEFLSANYYDAVYNIFPELIRRVVKKKGNPLNGEELENAIWDDPTFKTFTAQDAPEQGRHGGKAHRHLQGGGRQVDHRGQGGRSK